MCRLYKTMSVLLSAAAVFAQVPADYPVMDIRFRVENIDYDNTHGYFDIRIDVRTTDGSDPLAGQITHSLVLGAPLKDLVVSADTSGWAFHASNYEKSWSFDANTGVLGFDVTHRPSMPREGFGTTDPEVWQPLFCFSLIAERRIGETAVIDWNPGAPHYYVQAQGPWTTGDALIHRQAFGGPVEIGLEFYQQIMDICVRRGPVTFDGRNGSFRVFFDVRTTDGSGKYLFHMQDAVVFDSTLAAGVVSVNLTGSAFLDTEYEINRRYISSFGILEFQIVHIDMEPFSTLLGGPDSLTWHQVLQFDVNFEMASGQTGEINWYDGDPHLSIRAINVGGTPSTKLIHHRECCAPVVMDLGLPGADIALSQSFNDTQVDINQSADLMVNLINYGYENAGDIQTVIEMPPGLAVAGFSAQKGLFDLQNGTWRLALDAGERAMLHLVVAGKQQGTWTVNSSVQNTGVPDPVSGNNTSAAALLVTGQGTLTKIFARVFLEGPYRFAVRDPGHPSPEQMAVKLCHSVFGDTCYIPVLSPYADSLHRTTGVSHPRDLPPDIVDWVYLHLRPATDPHAENIELLHGFDGTSCFLRHDGALLDTDGSEGVWIPGLAEGDYYLQISHRNHLRVMSAVPVNTLQLTGYSFGGGAKNYYDFTEAAEKFFYINDPAQRGCCLQPVNGKWLIAAGDGDGAHQVENRDMDLWFETTGSTAGYHKTDYDLGSQVEGRDQTLVLDNMLLRSPFSWPSMNP